MATWTARAIGAPIQQTDTFVVQTVRFIKDGTPVKDVPITYAPGTDSASAQANLASAIRSAIAQRAPDGSTVAVAAGTLLDLSVAAPPPPTQAELDRAAWFAAYATVQRLQRGRATGVASITGQMVTDAQTSLNALPYDPSYGVAL